MPLNAERIYSKNGEWTGTLLMDIERGKVWDVLSTEATNNLIKELQGESKDE